MTRALAFLAGSLIALMVAAQQTPVTLPNGATVTLVGKVGAVGPAGPAGKDGVTPKCSVGTTTNNVKISVTPPCVFSFDFSGYTPSPAPAPTPTPAPTPAPSPAPTSGPQTWYVRPDGGNRYSANVPSGQCDGLGDAAYPGSGVNQHCAFNDIRLLWQDGSYAVSFKDSPGSNGKPETAFPARGWVGKGGDTYLLRGSVATGAKPYRIGWEWQQDCGGATAYPSANIRGWCGNPTAGPPSPPAGTAQNPTRILGENYGACNAQSARTALLPGWGVGAALALNTSYLDVECLDISDSSQLNGSYKNDDSATEGIALTSGADHLLLKNVRMHGLRTFGMLGPSGDGTVMDHVSWVGNGGGGWNADDGSGKTGVGSLLVTNYDIEWNGCAEEFPIKDPLPYLNCADQSSGGYGDGFGTATVVTNGWNAVFDTGTVAYNTQDGLDALHFVSNNGTSSFTVKNTQAYSNMGQQIKSGGDKGSILNSLIVGNCTAMSNAIPGTPAGYNANLSDFCRASNVAVVLSANNGSTAVLKGNKIYGAGTILVQVDCTSDCSQPTTLMDSEGNLFNGNARSDGQGYPAAYYFLDPLGDLFANLGSVNAANTFWGVKPGTYAYEDTGSVTTGAAVAVPAYGLGTLGGVQ